MHILNHRIKLLRSLERTAVRESSANHSNIYEQQIMNMAATLLKQFLELVVLKLRNICQRCRTEFFLVTEQLACCTLCLHAACVLHEDTPQVMKDLDAAMRGTQVKAKMKNARDSGQGGALVKYLEERKQKYGAAYIDVLSRHKFGGGTVPSGVNACEELAHLVMVGVQEQPE